MSRYSVFETKNKKVFINKNTADAHDEKKERFIEYDV